MCDARHEVDVVATGPRSPVHRLAELGKLRGPGPRSDPSTRGTTIVATAALTPSPRNRAAPREKLFRRADLSSSSGERRTPISRSAAEQRGAPGTSTMSTNRRRSSLADDSHDPTSPHRGPKSICVDDIALIAELMGAPLTREVSDFFLVASEAINRRTVRARVEPRVDILNRTLDTLHKSATSILDGLCDPALVELAITTESDFGRLDVVGLREQLRVLASIAKHAKKRVKRGRGGGPAFERSNSLSDGAICALIIMEADKRYAAASEEVNKPHRTRIYNLGLHEAAEKLWLATGNPKRGKEEGNLDAWRRSFEAAKDAPDFWKHWVASIPPR